MSRAAMFIAGILDDIIERAVDMFAWCVVIFARVALWVVDRFEPDESSEQ